MQPMIWVGLGYNIPANPSKNRVYVWRKLKELGAVYFKQGVALLPKSAQNLSKFNVLAVKIREMGGEASLVEMRFLEPGDEAGTVHKFQRQSEDEYRELLRDCAMLMENIRQNRLEPPVYSDRMRKLIKRYGKVKSRDYFHSRSRSDIAGALEELAGDMARVADDLGRQLRGMLDL